MKNKQIVVFLFTFIIGFLFTFMTSSFFVSQETGREMLATAYQQSLVDNAQTISLARDPNPDLAKAILEASSRNCSQVTSRQGEYNYIRVNLNRDSKEEIIAITNLGGTGGVPTYIFDTQGSNYQLVSEIGLSRWHPLFITERFTNGWRDLVMYAEERHNSDQYFPFLLQKGTNGYPKAVHQGERLPSSERVSGLKVESDPDQRFSLCSTTPKQNTGFVYLHASNPDARIMLRSRPTISSPDRGYGLVGDKVKVLDTTQGSDNFTWYKVRFPESGAVGWIRGDLVRSN